MAKLEEQAINVLTQLTKLMRTMQMYNPNHPAVKTGMDMVQKDLQVALATDTMLHIGQQEGNLIIQGRPVEQKLGPFKRFMEALIERRIDSFEVKRGVTTAQLDQFVRLLAMRTEDVLQDDKIKPALTAGMTHITLNAVEYVAVRKGDDPRKKGSSNTDYGEGGFQGWMGRLFESEVVEGAGGRSIEDVMVALFGKMAPELETMDAGEAAQFAKDYFAKASDHLVNQFQATVQDTAENLRKSIAQFAPSIQQDLFGKTFGSENEIEIDRILQSLAPEVKAQIMINEMKKGAVDPQQLDGPVKTLLTTPGDIVNLAEQISQRLAVEGGENEGEYLSRLWRLIQSGRRIEDLEEATLGMVLIADTEDALVEDYKTILERAGYRCHCYRTGNEALAAVREKDPDVFIMDIKLPGMTGIEILSALDSERRHIPVIVASAQTQFREAFEVQMYPKLTWMPKPPNYRDLFETVEKVIPKRKRKEVPPPAAPAPAAPGVAAPASPDGEDAAERDMKKAREVQAKLLPSKLPKIPGFDLCAYYNACKDIGGDYFDFIPVGSDKIGIVIADVSGKAVSGAMVMVMARTLFRQIAPSLESPKETLIRVNESLALDIRRGMFMTAYYVILDIPTQTLTMCCAGHNPAVYWDDQIGLCTMTEPSGMAMGLIGSSAFGKSLKEETVKFKNGDRIYFYTDGVVECMNHEEEEYGEKRLIQLMNRSSRKKSPEVVAASIEDLKAYQGEAPTHDDVTIVTFRRMGGKN